ncbi:hypothetical protein LSAT2_020134 [Lamellibrachia satsuma]|nr:hypothetical protein LSAT2_020134 [Lamellibrachia satsuma]
MISHHSREARRVVYSGRGELSAKTIEPHLPEFLDQRFLSPRWGVVVVFVFWWGGGGRKGFFFCWGGGGGGGGGGVFLGVVGRGRGSSILISDIASVFQQKVCSHTITFELPQCSTPLK